MTEDVRRMLMGLAREDYLKRVEQRKAEERALEEEVKRRKELAEKSGHTSEQGENNK